MYKIIKTIHKNLLIFFIIDFVKLQLKQVRKLLKDKIPLDTLNSCVDYLKNKNISETLDIIEGGKGETSYIKDI